MSTATGRALWVRAAMELATQLLRNRISPSRRAARRHHAEYYRDLWIAAAAHVGAPVRELRSGELELTLDSGAVRVRGTYCSIDGQEVLDRAGDKTIVHRLLVENGLPMPEYCTFTLADIERAGRFLADAPGDCVVKPGQDSAAGLGVTTRVREPRDLLRAAVLAAAAGARSRRPGRTAAPMRRLVGMLSQLGDVPLLIEHQVGGENYRLLYLDGVLVDALRRGSPTVVGDGHTTVGGLLERLNDGRLRAGGQRAQMLVTRDLDCERTLAAQDLTFASVPEAGETVRIKTTINENAPDNNHPAIDRLGVSIVEQGARAAATVGARWAGVDIITADPGVPLECSGGCILEVNTTPGLAMHYHGRPGATEPARLLLKHLSGASVREQPVTAAARPPVIVVGGETNALSIARSLGAMGVQVYGLGVSSFVLRSRYMRAIRLPAHDDEERAWADCLLGSATDHLRGAVVLAGSDAGITVLARYRTRLLERFLLDESDVDAQLGMLDKLTTYEAAVAAGVPTPLFWRVDGPEDLERYRDHYVYPLIVKPLLSHQYQIRFPGRTKFRIVDDLAALRVAHRELTQAGLGVMLVERIPGPDTLLCSYYTYIDRSGSPTFDLTKRILRRFPPGMGLACYHITDWNPEVKDLALQLFKFVGLRGLANAEFKRDERDGRLKLIECNARFTAANSLVAAAGLDLARHVYLRILSEPHELPSRYTTGLRMLYPSNDLRAFLALRAASELSFGQWLRSLMHRHTFPHWRWDDPAPALARGALRSFRGLRQACAITRRAASRARR